MKSVGSFNWLYKINDTVLFNKDTGRFETAIIGLAGRIRVDKCKEYSNLIKAGRKGDLFIVDDFGFVIVHHQLKGWFLKKASEHVCVTREYNKEIAPHMLARYLNALKLWEEDKDETELKSLLEECKIKEDEFSCALRECIMNLL